MEGKALVADEYHMFVPNGKCERYQDMNAYWRSLYEAWHWTFYQSHENQWYMHALDNLYAQIGAFADIMSSIKAISDWVQDFYKNLAVSLNLP